MPSCHSLTNASRAFACYSPADAPISYSGCSESIAYYIPACFPATGWYSTVYACFVDTDDSTAYDSESATCVYSVQICFNGDINVHSLSDTSGSQHAYTIANGGRCCCISRIAYEDQCTHERVAASVFWIDTVTPDSFSTSNSTLLPMRHCDPSSRVRK
jgi:hypothetical protein